MNTIAVSQGQFIVGITCIVAMSIWFGVILQKWQHDKHSRLKEDVKLVTSVIDSLTMPLTALLISQNCPAPFETANILDRKITEHLAIWPRSPDVGLSVGSQFIHMLSSAEYPNLLTIMFACGDLHVHLSVIGDSDRIVTIHGPVKSVDRFLITCQGLAQKEPKS